MATCRLTTEEDKDLPAFDYTKLTALNMCPRWGLIRYDQHKRMPGESRAMALEMGQAAHEAFAAVRLFQLMEYTETPQDVVDATALRVFGNDQYKVDQLYSVFRTDEDWRQRVIAMAHTAVHNSGFYDDPSDRRRTTSNLEISLTAYCDRLDLPRYVPYVDGSYVGIENTFDMVIEFDTGEQMRYIGKFDGLMVDMRDGHELVEENKTASRLDQSWHDSFVMSHQVTGYLQYASLRTGRDIRDADVLGLMVPLPKTYDLGGFSRNNVPRESFRFEEWTNWLYDTYKVWERYKDNPLSAPEYTHSCNRYFRSCSFIPLCASPLDERTEMFGEMVHDEWSPLTEGQTDG